ncbi:MAG: hypothetical protein U0903_17700 [Planctomycetales bacterium]
MPGLARLKNNSWMGLLLACVCLTGCPAKQGKFIPDDLKKQASVSTPVKGKLLINGAPAKSRIRVTARGKDAPPEDTGKHAFTDVNGNFEFMTVEKGDGLIPGKYDITILWGKTSLLRNTYFGPDKLGDKYGKKSPWKEDVVVEQGKPLDLGTIDLKVELPKDMEEPNDVDRLPPGPPPGGAK